MLFQFCTELVRRIGKGLQRLIVLDVHHIVVVDQNYGPLPLAPHHRPADVPVQAVILNGIEAPVLRILTEVLYAADVFLKEFFYSPLRRGIGDALHRYIVIEQLLNSPAQMHEINFMIFHTAPFLLSAHRASQAGWPAGSFIRDLLSFVGDDFDSPILQLLLNFRAPFDKHTFFRLQRQKICS